MRDDVAVWGDRLAEPEPETEADREPDVGIREGPGGVRGRGGGRRVRVLARMGIGVRSDGLCISLDRTAGRGIRSFAAVDHRSTRCISSTIWPRSSTIRLKSALRRSIPLISLRIRVNISSICNGVSSSKSLARTYRDQSSK